MKIDCIVVWTNVHRFKIVSRTFVFVLIIILSTLSTYRIYVAKSNKIKNYFICKYSILCNLNKFTSCNDYGIFYILFYSKFVHNHILKKKLWYYSINGIMLLKLNKNWTKTMNNVHSLCYFAILRIAVTT